MVEKIISPNVFVRESDKSLVTRGPVTTGAAIVGPTVKGRPLVPTVVTSYSEYQSVFGETFKSGSQYYEYFTSLAAKEYFSGGGGSLLVTRIISGSAYNQYAQASVVTQATSGSARATGSGIIANTFVANDEVRITYGSNLYRFIASGNPVPADDVDGNIYFFSTGSSTATSTVNLANEINGALSGSSATSLNLLSASVNTNTLVISASAGGTLYNGITVATGSVSSFATLITLAGGTDSVTEAISFVLESKDYGAELNNTGSLSSAGALASGSDKNIRWEVTNVEPTKGTFSIIVRRGDDNNSSKNILETWTNLSLDPNLPNFISRQIGDEKPVYVAAVGTEAAYVQLTGSFTGGSQYVRVASITTLHADSIDNDGYFKTGSYSGSLPTVGSGSYGGSFNGGVAATNLGSAAYFDAVNTTATNVQGFVDADYVVGLNLLSNKDEYDFNLLLTPGMFLGAGAAISDSTDVSIVEGRGDSFSIKDLVAYGDTKANAVSAAAASTSNYAAGYWPWVQTFSANLGRPVWVPPSVVMAGVYAFNDAVGAEWFAPAGLNRGGIGSVIRAEKRLSADDRDTLYAANVNPLATFPGEGVVAFGQKTFQKRATSLDRVNVRRLLINLKRFVSSVSRQLVFEQNTTVTRNRFLATVNPYMEQVVSQQGLYAYKVIMDETNNSADVIDRNQLVGQIYVQPTKTAEYIILDFTLQPTGATFPA